MLRALEPAADSHGREKGELNASTWAVTPLPALQHADDVGTRLVKCLTHSYPDSQAENRRDKAEARGLTGGILVDLSHSSRTELRARKRITKCAGCLNLFSSWVVPGPPLSSLEANRMVEKVMLMCVLLHAQASAGGAAPHSGARGEPGAVRRVADEPRGRLHRSRHAGGCQGMCLSG